MSNSKLVKFHGNCYCFSNDSELYIPVVDAFINQELYQDMYSWFAYQFNINVRFIPLFKYGTKPTNKLTILDAMKNKYGVDVGIEVFLKSYRTYFKEPRDLRAIAIALLRTGRNADLPDALLNDIKIFLESIASGTGHCSVMTKYVLEKDPTEKTYILDSALRCPRSNALESLLYIDLAKTPEELAAILGLLQNDIDVLIQKPTPEQIIDNVSVYVWFIDKLLFLKDIDKKYQYARRLHTAAKKLTYKSMSSETLRDHVRNALDWEDDILYVLNLHCNYFLSKKHNLTSNIKPVEMIEVIAHVYMLSQTKYCYSGLDEMSLEFLKEVRIQCAYNTDAYKEFVRNLCPCKIADPVTAYTALHDSLGEVITCYALQKGFISSVLDTPLNSMTDKEKHAVQIYKMEQAIEQGGSSDEKTLSPEQCIKFLQGDDYINTNKLPRLLKGTKLEFSELLQMYLKDDNFNHNLTYAFRNCSRDDFLQDLFTYIVQNTTFQQRDEQLKWYCVDYGYARTTPDKFNIYGMFKPGSVWVTDEIRETILDDILSYAIAADLQHIDCILYQYYIQLGMVQDDADAILQRFCEQLGYKMADLGDLAKIIKSDDDYAVWSSEHLVGTEVTDSDTFSLGELLDFIDDYSYTCLDEDTAQKFVNSLIPLDPAELGDYSEQILMILDDINTTFDICVADYLEKFADMD